MSFRESDIMDIFDDHMRAQPYQCECAKCGAKLDYAAQVDNDNDLSIQVEPCDCIREE